VNPSLQREQCILLSMATSRDAGMTADVLVGAGIQALACRDMPTLIAELARGAGALLVAEETLGRDEQAALSAALAAQPAWSDIAVLLLARQGADSVAIVRAMDRLANLTVLERPVRVAALVSALRSALRARLRQYEVRALLEDLRRADQRKTEFLATLAHELRNPLAPIKTTLTLLSSRTLEPEAVEHGHKVMHRQVDHLARLVDDLMEISRITRGKVDLQFGPLLLDAVIADAVELSRPLIDAAGHGLTVEPGREPLPVNGDAVRLTQVFSNLLNNAAKYTSPGGRLAITARRDGGDAVVDVSDNGAGLTPDMLKSVFEMFVQASGTSRLAQGGLGIGLTLVRSLVELHGGSVLASSAGLQRGSTFSVRLPLHDGVSPPAESSGKGAAGAGLSVDGSVLVVDDNHDAADSLATLLRAMGATARAAYDGEQALRMATDTPIALAILDIGMPGMDGCELARRLRAMPGGTGLRLIALTGWGQPHDRQRLVAAGFDHHLLKPMDLRALADLLGSPRPASAPIESKAPCSRD
jgi:signal transduction histidine kinase/CheY-like chemotaxis protein